jgi:hypothetical protein
MSYPPLGRRWFRKVALIIFEDEFSQKVTGASDPCRGVSLKDVITGIGEEMV